MKGLVRREEGAPRVDRWELIRDVVVFQVKLGLDALRDLVLSPLSILAGLLDLLAGDRPGGPLFYRLLALGRRSDEWIDLFNRHRERGEPETRRGATVDALVAQVEKVLVDQAARGGVTAQAKDAIDRSLDKITRTSRS